MKSVTIDRRRPLREEPHTGHNRWHPDIPPIIEVEEGEEVALETRDATDGYLTAKSSEADFAGLPVGAIHPLTGPVLVTNVICSVAVDLRISNVVDVPNYVVSALLPEDIFSS
jgi:formamidase